VVLIGYWPLNESSGSTAYDHSGNENHGSINDGGDSTVPGANGILGQNAYSFDGSNDYIDSGSSFSGFSGFTFSAWVYFEGFSDSDRYEGLFGTWDGGFDNYTRASYNAPVDSFIFQIEDGYSNSLVIDSPSLSEKQWYHIVTVSGKDQLYVYVNAEEIGRGGSPQYPTPDNGDISIGAFPDYGGSNPIWLNGRMQEVRVYNHALTPREVQYLYTASKRGRQVSISKSS
jgi:hypothetical protein